MSLESRVPGEDRYARQQQIEGWDQKRLAEARVLVAGAGAIGNEVLKLLALLGVGRVFIVDFDRVEVTNLTRSVLFRDGDIGRSKAEVAAERLQDLNPDCKAMALPADLEFEIGLGVYRTMDLVIGCLDSINARLALNRACLRAGVPWLNGGIEATFGEIALFERDFACFECSMTPGMWENRNRRYSCGGLQAELPPDQVPTTATVASIIAGYLVHEALCLLHSRPERAKEGLLPGQQIYLSLQPYDFRQVNLPINPGCLAHEGWEPDTILAEHPCEFTVASLLRRMGMQTGVLELGFDLLTTMDCIQCGQREEILRPVEKSPMSLTLCPHCGNETRYPTTVSWMDIQSEYADHTLAALGIPEHQIVALKEDDVRRYCQLSGIFRL